MEVKVVLGLAAVGFELVSMAFYFKDIFRGRTQPHLYTFLIWVIVTSIVFAGQVVAGGGAGAWATGVTAFLQIVTLALCFKYGTKDITRVDALFLIGALLSIIPWLMTKDPLWSVVLASTIDAFAMGPTIRKTWRAPMSESLLSWLVAEGKYVTEIPALSVYSVTTLIYPLQAVSMNAVLIIIMLLRRRN
ncbi:MAG: hypothetical protein JO019_02680 [Candidatus Kaiserbacteria bacterium]|nr:hypothetical protein [Candidatus Kaiserbacteria bacterium]